MTRRAPGPWRELLAILAIMTGTIVLLVLAKQPASSPWLRRSVGVLVLVATAAPALPFLALIPWHFIAVRRGLIRRSRAPCAVSLAQEILRVERGAKLTRHALGTIARARFARNDNWTESKILEDALSLFASNGREIERLPQSATGLDELLAELGARGIPIEDVYVSAPAVLD